MLEVGGSVEWTTHARGGRVFTFSCWDSRVGSVLVGACKGRDWKLEKKVVINAKYKMARE